MSGLITVLFILLTIPSGILAENLTATPECEIVIDDFANGIKPDWKTKSFKGTTEYTWIKEENRAYVKATSRGTASGLYYEIEFDPQQYPYLSWQWEVCYLPLLFLLEHQGNKLYLGQQVAERTGCAEPVYF